MKRRTLKATIKCGSFFHVIEAGNMNELLVRCAIKARESIRLIQDAELVGITGPWNLSSGKKFYELVIGISNVTTYEKHTFEIDVERI